MNQPHNDLELRNDLRKGSGFLFEKRFIRVLLPARWLHAGFRGKLVLLWCRRKSIHICFLAALTVFTAVVLLQNMLLWRQRNLWKACFTKGSGRWKRGHWNNHIILPPPLLLLLLHRYTSVAQTHWQWLIRVLSNTHRSKVLACCQHSRWHCHCMCCACVTYGCKQLQNKCNI